MITMRPEGLAGLAGFGASGTPWVPGRDLKRHRRRESAIVARGLVRHVHENGIAPTFQGQQAARGFSTAPPGTLRRRAGNEAAAGDGEHVASGARQRDTEAGASFAVASGEGRRGRSAPDKWRCSRWSPSSPSPT